MKRLLLIPLVFVLSGCAASAASIVTVNVAVNASAISGPEIVGIVGAGAAVGTAGYEFYEHETAKGVKQHWDQEGDGHGQGGWVDSVE